MRSPASLCTVALLAMGPAACGKKGPPLPPLVRVPAAPVEMTVERRGQTVDVRFAVPSANTDGSRPANIQRVEIYALDGPKIATEAEVLKTGARVGAIDVKAPRDPNETVDADEPDSDMQPLEGPGLDQGATAHVRDSLKEAGLGGEASTRTYVGVAITTRGRRGPASKAAAVPLGPAPGAPSQPSLSYDETTITISWTPVIAPALTENGEAPTVAYHVYDVSPAPPSSRTGSDGASPNEGQPTRLTDTALSQPTYTDKRITWDAERCYVIRTVRAYGDLVVEGDPSRQRCATLKDTFPPAPPTGVTAVASEGSINLIWTPNNERDLSGYRVLRATLPSGELTPMTPKTITESSFADAVQAGVRYAYAVQAIDSAGNASAPSDRVEETAR